MTELRIPFKHRFKWKSLWMYWRIPKRELSSIEMNIKDGGVTGVLVYLCDNIRQQNYILRKCNIAGIDVGYCSTETTFMF
jgi:hypothetical protein